MPRVEAGVQRLLTGGRDAGPAPPGRSYLVRLDSLAPVVHLVHRRPQALNLRQRIIVDHELVWIEAGAGEFVLAGRALPYRAGAVLAIPPFTPHEFRAPAAGPAAHVAVHFDPSPATPARSATLATRRPYLVRFPRGATLAAVTPSPAANPAARGIRNVLEAWERGGEAGLALARAELTAVLVRLLAVPAPARPAGPASSRVRALVERTAVRMEERMDEPNAVPDLARWAGLSPTHFTRAFRVWTGFSPHAYLLRVRIERARRLLADPALSVKQVAARTGFGDAFHFSKAFRAAVGLPPTRYRELLLADRR